VPTTVRKDAATAKRFDTPGHAFAILAIKGRLASVAGPHVKRASSLPAASRTQADQARGRVYARLRLAGRFVTRSQLDDAFDQLRLRFDTFPDGLYQPVPALGVRISQRAAGCESRWRAIEPLLQRLKPATAVDIGANACFFSFKLAEQGCLVTAVESGPANVRTAVLAVRRSRQPRVAVMSLEITPQNLALIPHADATLFLAVWHHLTRAHGLQAATQMLSAIWTHTLRILIFETGPVASAPADMHKWLRKQLRSACPGGRVESLGLRPAAAPGSPRRELFAVIREPSHAVAPGPWSTLT
jgi:hypothetical protein